MVKRLRSRLCVERLEERCCPTITAGTNPAGLLVVGGASDGDVKITQIGLHGYRVEDVVTDASNVSHDTYNAKFFSSSLPYVLLDVNVNVDAHGHHVFIDLHGFSGTRSIAVTFLAGPNGAPVGPNNLTVYSSTVNLSKSEGITGRLTVRGNNGQDTVFIGGDGNDSNSTGFAPLTVKGIVSVQTFDGADTLVVLPGVHVGKSLTATDANSLTLSAGTQIDGTVTIKDGLNGYTSHGNTIQLLGTVLKNVTIDTHNNSSPDLVTAGPLSSIGSKMLPDSPTVPDALKINLTQVGPSPAPSVVTLDGHIYNNNLHVISTTAYGTNVNLVTSLIVERNAIITLNKPLGDSLVKSTVTVDGTINASLLIASDNTLETDISFGGIVKDNVTIHLDQLAGTDFSKTVNKVDLNGTIGTFASGRSLLAVKSGAGLDDVAFDQNLVLHGVAKVLLGVGDDTFTLDPAARVGNTLDTLIEGGAGANTFTGNKNYFQDPDDELLHFVFA